MKLSVIIPVFNEAATVATLLTRVWDVKLKDMEKELVIVESNSTDGSREAVQKWVAERNAGDSLRLILQEKPQGKGFAVREGFAAATGEIILIQDADLEYDVNDYPQLLAPIIDGRTNFVLGSRHLSAGSWKIRSFEKNAFKATFMNLGGVLFHGFFNIVYGQTLTDPTTMYKVFRRECIRGMHFVSSRFDFDFELTAKLIRAGNSPLEIPISYRSRGFEEGKKVNIFRDPFMWVSAILRFRFSPIYLDGTSVAPIALPEKSDAVASALQKD